MVTGLIDESREDLEEEEVGFKVDVGVAGEGLVVNGQEPSS